MGVWTVCYWDLKTMRNEWTTFDFVEDVQEFLEGYEVEVKNKFKLNTLDESVTVFQPKSDVRASEVVNGKFDRTRY